MKILLDRPEKNMMVNVNGAVSIRKSVFFRGRETSRHWDRSSLGLVQ